MKHLTTCLFLLFSITSMFGQSADDFYEKAMTKVEQEDFQYASVLIDKAIHLNDTNVWHWLKKAHISTLLEDPAMTIACIKKAISIDSTKSESYNCAGIFYESFAMADSSIYMYNQAIRFAKNDTSKFSYIHNRGTVKSKVRDFEGALSDYEQVLEFMPNKVSTLNNIAPVYRQLNMPKEAIACLKRVIAIDSSWVGPYINLGFAYNELDSLDKALAYFNQALILEPDEALVFSNRGHTYYRLGRYDEAIQDLNKSISLYPSNSYAYRNLALVYFAIDGKDEACNALSYAARYGFTIRYGSEVDELIAEHCDE